MVTARVRTLPTEPTDREIVKYHSLVLFINIGQKGRKIGPVIPPLPPKKTVQIIWLANNRKL